MSKPFHKPSVKKPPHVKKFSTQRYSSLCRDSKCPTIWMLVYCGAGTSLGPQLGTSRLSGRPAFGLTPSEPWGPSLRPLGSSCPSVNSIHSWVFTITALGAVVLSKELFVTVNALIYLLTPVDLKKLPNIDGISLHLSSKTVCCYCFGIRMLHANFIDHELVQKGIKLTHKMVSFLVL